MGMIQMLETLSNSKVRHMELMKKNVFKWVRSDGCVASVGTEFSN